MKFPKNLIPGSIERDLLKRHTGPFVFCFFTIMFLLLMQFLIQYMDRLVGKGIPFLVIVELILVNLAYMVVLAVPMTILAATLMAYGKFAEQNEFTAIRAAGVHPFRIIRPVLGVAIAMSLFLGWFSNEVLPEANYKARALFLDIRMNKPGFDLQENTFYEGIEGYTFLVRNISQETDSLYDVTLFQNPVQGRDRAVIKASKGLLESNEQNMSLTLHLFDGSIMRYLQRQQAGSRLLHEQTDFESYRITFDLSDLTFSRTNPEERRRDGRSMSAQAMLATVDSLKKEMQLQVQNFRKNLEYSHITLKQSPGTDPPVYRNVANNKSDGRPPMETLPYKTLQRAGSLEEQLEILGYARTHLRDTQTHIEELRNNLRWREERVARFMVEVHKKASIPFACILFALIGAPLGLLVQKGNMGIHALISTVLFTYYWIGIIQGEKMADRLFISPFTGMWFANITMALAAVVLLYQVIIRR